MNQTTFKPIEVANSYTSSFMELALPDDGILCIQVLRTNKDYEQKIMDSFQSDQREDLDIYDLFQKSIMDAIEKQYPHDGPRNAGYKLANNRNPLLSDHYSEYKDDSDPDYPFYWGCEITLCGTDTNWVITITAQAL